MTATPDYLGLFRLLDLLRTLPDARRETTLTQEEAARIRSLGFAAEAGCWKVPPLPPELVRGNQLFENYSEGWDELEDGLLPVSQIQKPVGQTIARTEKSSSKKMKNLSANCRKNGRRNANKKQRKRSVLRKKFLCVPFALQVRSRRRIPAREKLPFSPSGR
jgi:hypothetical protein